VVRLTRQKLGAGRGLRPATARDVRRHLRHEVFLHYLAIGDRLWVTSVGPTRTVLTELGSLAAVTAAVDTLTFGLRRTLTGRMSSSSRPALADAIDGAARRLDALLLAPLTRQVGDADLVLCPAGPLTRVPWSLLPTCQGRVARIAPSATVWCRARSATPDREARVLVVAGPGLAGAEDEAWQVARTHHDAHVLIGSDATVARVLDEVHDATVLHLAAHGRLRRDNPLFSALELADGPLTAYDLEALDRVPDSVVLSACSSGAGHATVADETLGLAWTLMSLGSCAVVAPLLPVPDIATRAVMVNVHRGLAAGLEPAVALATTQAAADAEDPVAISVAAAFVAYGS
jgi:CHAT domain-containing protein